MLAGRWRQKTLVDFLLNIPLFFCWHDMAVKPEQLHELLTYCFDFAKLMLSDSGEFYPFGAVLGFEGKLNAVGIHDGNEHPNPQDLFRLLEDTFKVQAARGEIIASAMAANVNIPSTYESPCPDGIRVHLEGNDYSRFIYFPYRISKIGIFKRKMKIEVLEPFSVEIQPSFFAKPSAPGAA
ncbi:hypothetical protein [Janthinobacterium sp. MDB2-8]|uniref:hypothetical protein n=1 Tax=Janthinobacterium sp. MDB2-8 TaxID=1259338 RepID=UPI003F20725D